MTDSLSKWMRLYLDALKEGKVGPALLEAAEIDLQTFSEARMTNSAFANAIALYEAGIGCTKLTVNELFKLREAQVPEKRVAAYFGLGVDELRWALEDDENLRKAYNLGPERGLANVQKAQYEAAVCGDTNMLKHMGEHYLEQKSSTKVEVDLAGVDAMIKKLEAQLDQKRVAGLISAPDVVEGKYEEVEETE